MRPDPVQGVEKIPRSPNSRAKPHAGLEHRSWRKSKRPKMAIWSGLETGQSSRRWCTFCVWCSQALHKEIFDEVNSMSYRSVYTQWGKSINCAWLKPSGIFREKSSKLTADAQWARTSKRIHKINASTTVLARVRWAFVYILVACDALVPINAIARVTKDTNIIQKKFLPW